MHLHIVNFDGVILQHLVRTKRHKSKQQGQI